MTGIPGATTAVGEASLVIQMYHLQQQPLPVPLKTLAGAMMTGEPSTVGVCSIADKSTFFLLVGLTCNIRVRLFANQNDVDVSGFSQEDEAKRKREQKRLERQKQMEEKRAAKQGMKLGTKKLARD